MNTYELVKIKDTDYPVAFNQYAVAKILNALEIKLADVIDPENKDPESVSKLNDLDLEQMHKVCYYGLVGGHAAKYEEDFPLTYIQTCVRLFGENSVLGDIMAVWSKHMSVEKEAEKPKRTAKASKTQAKPKKQLPGTT